jgi:hypothetical protein
MSEIFPYPLDSEPDLLQLETKHRLERLINLREDGEYEQFFDDNWAYKENYYNLRQINITRNCMHPELLAKKIMLPHFNARNLRISLVEQNISEEQDYSWVFNMSFRMGNVPHKITVDEDCMTVTDLSRQHKRPRKFDSSFGPRFLVGFMFGLAEDKNAFVENYEEYDYIQKGYISDKDLFQVFENIISEMSDIDGEQTVKTATPVLDFGDSAIKATYCETYTPDMSKSEMHIDLAKSNPLGLMVYSFHSVICPEADGLNSVLLTKQAIDGSLTTMDIDIDLYGYRPTVINPIKDREAYFSVVKDIEETISRYS